jgi:putative CocE/NonD family hydrolase
LNAKVDQHIVNIENTWIPLSDGCRLAARLWLPPDVQKNPVPAILEYLPYRKRDMTAERDAKNYPYVASHGYAGVRVDMRGCGDSDGLIHGEYLKQEQDDALEVIAWIASQPWCDGNVGMIGISWGGFNGLQVAARQPPALKAVISLCSTDDRYADDIHFMGGCLLTDKLTWGANMLARTTAPPDPALVGEGWREMWLERMQKCDLWAAEWHTHQRRDAFYKHGSICEDYDAIQTPVYLVGGWADGYSNAIFRMLANLNCPVKALIGPWAHLYPNIALPGPAIGFQQECIRWWDRWLRGIDNGIMQAPQLRAWIQEPVPPQSRYDQRPGRWICEDGWPATRISKRAYALTPKGLRESDATSANFTICSPQTVGLSSGSWFPLCNEPDLPTDQRQDAGGCLVFNSEPLNQGFEILGAPVLNLTLSADRPNAIVAAVLSDVQPDGAATQISYGLLNLTHRNGHETPQPLEPGKSYQVTIQLNEIGHHFHRDHRIRLALSNAYWPLVWPSPETVILEVDAAGSIFELPVRPPNSQDKQLIDYEPVASDSSLNCQHVAPPESRWTITTDVRTGMLCHERMFDSGMIRIVDYDWEFGNRNHRLFYIHPDDPLSARCEVRSQHLYGRGDWQVRIDSTVTMTVSKDSFDISAELNAKEGESHVLSRNWKEKIPRDLV